jgi:hypothetical protein
VTVSQKARVLLKQIYSYRGRGEERFVDENTDEALEYLLAEIVDNLTSRVREEASTPLHMMVRRAVGRLNVNRVERQSAAI